MPKTIQNRPSSCLNKGFCQERVQMQSWSAPGLILEGFARLPGASWAILGPSWNGLGRSWAPLGRILGSSMVLLDASWLPNATQDGLGLDFGRSGRRFWNVFGRPGLVLEAFGRIVTVLVWNPF